jgi:hypothetical protein
MRSIQELIEKYEERLNQSIDPDNSTWDDLGFDEPPEGYESPREFQRLNGERDEGDQAREGLIGEFIEDLKGLQKDMMEEQRRKAKAPPASNRGRKKIDITSPPRIPKKKK